MTEQEFTELRVQAHQNAEMIQALVVILDQEFLGLREAIRDRLHERMREFSGNGWDEMAAANRDLAAGPLFTGL